MNEYKDEMLADAIKTALDYGYEIKTLKKIIFALCLVIFSLIIGYFA